MAERKAWWEILRDQFAARGLLDPESERVQEATQALPSVQRQARGLLSLDPQAESDTALEMGLGSLPGVGQAMALRDFERARRTGDKLGMGLATLAAVPVVGGVAKSSGRLSSKNILDQVRELDPKATISKSFSFDTANGKKIPMWYLNLNGQITPIGKTLEDVDVWIQEALPIKAAKIQSERINTELGLPKNSLTGQWAQRGFDASGNPFNMEMARKTAEKIKFRHEQTEYDNLLSSGQMDKDEARAYVVEKMTSNK